MGSGAPVAGAQVNGLHDAGAHGLVWPPRHEPEVRRANARRYIAAQNRRMSEPYSDADIYIVLEVARNACDAHGGTSAGWRAVLAGRGRFSWVYDEDGAADECVKIKDTVTGRVVIDPNWG
jgi:hypothetical protein